MAAECTARRAANVSLTEKHFLVELANKYATVIENKQTDKVTMAEKSATWKLIASEYNAVCTVKRTDEQLKQVFEVVCKCCHSYDQINDLLMREKIAN
jgi:cytochrome c5